MTVAAAIAASVLAMPFAGTAAAQRDQPSPEELWDAYPLDPDRGDAEEPAPPGTTGPQPDETDSTPTARAVTPVAQMPAQREDDGRLPTGALLAAVVVAFAGGLTAGRIRKRRLAARAAAPVTAVPAAPQPERREPPDLGFSQFETLEETWQIEPAAPAKPREVEPPKAAPPEVEPPEAAPPEVEPPELESPKVEPPEPEPPEVDRPEPEPEPEASKPTFLELEPVEHAELDLADGEPAGPPDVDLPEPEPIRPHPPEPPSKSFLELEPAEPDADELDLADSDSAGPPDVELPASAPIRTRAAKPEPEPEPEPAKATKPAPPRAPEPEPVEAREPETEPVAPPRREPEREPVAAEPEFEYEEYEEVVYEQYEGDEYEYVEEPVEAEEEQPWVAARRFARDEPWPETATDSWTCEIAWKAGYVKSSFRAMVASPNSSRRKPIGESRTLKWTLMMDADAPTRDLVTALQGLEVALEEAGWEQIEPGGPWYALRFVWHGQGRPQRVEPSGQEALTGTEGTDE